MNTLEALEPRTLASVAVAPWNGHRNQTAVMGPWAPDTAIVFTVERKVKQPPTITPTPPPQPTVVYLADPTDIAVATIPANATLWGTWNGDGVTPLVMPREEDVRQGYIGDCWLLGPIKGMVISDPGKLVSMLTVDTNGGYLVKVGTTLYHLSDTLCSYGAQFGPDYALFPMILEKFDAIIHGGAYSNLNGGWMTTAANDLGWGYQTIYPLTSADSLATLVNSDAASGANITVGTTSSAGDGLIGSHCYILAKATQVNGEWTFTAKQPWGDEFDVQLSYVQVLNPNNFYSSWVWSF